MSKPKKSDEKSQCISTGQEKVRISQAYQEAFGQPSKTLKTTAQVIDSIYKIRLIVLQIDQDERERLELKLTSTNVDEQLRIASYLFSMIELALFEFDKMSNWLKRHRPEFFGLLQKDLLKLKESKNRVRRNILKAQPSPEDIHAELAVGGVSILIGFFLSRIDRLMDIKDELLKRTKPKPGDDKEKTELANEKKTTHSIDFRSVRWFGTDYTFTPNQAAAVKMLWENWEKGTPDIGGDTLAVEIESDSRRARDIFKGHPAFGTMICPGKTKGTYRLVEPDK